MIGSVGFFLFVLIVASFFGKRGIIEIYQAKRKQEALLQKIEQLDAKKRKLERDIEELQKNRVGSPLRLKPCCLIHE